VIVAAPLLALFACVQASPELPTEERVAAIDALDESSTPPLYQYMYDSAFLPDVHRAEQRTRILVWLRHVELYDYQLTMLLGLHERAATLKQRIEAVQQKIIEQYEPQLVPAYDELFELLRAGAAVDDPRVEELAVGLAAQASAQARYEELLAIRLQSVRALLDEEQEFLRTLSPQQEALFPDAVFVLRRDLDLASNSGDFKALVGSLFSEGDPTLLLRGDFEATREPLDIGGLWSDQAKDEIKAPVLHEARRELLLYLLLQEPALPEAVQAALDASAATGGSASAPEPRGDPGPRNGGDAPPGAVHGQPEPAPPGAPRSL